MMHYRDLKNKNKNGQTNKQAPPKKPRAKQYVENIFKGMRRKSGKYVSGDLLTSGGVRKDVGSF